MNKNNYFAFKFISTFYLKLKEIRLNSLDKKIQTMQNKIDNGKLLLEENKQYLDTLTIENALIKEDFYNLAKLFETERKTITLKNNNFDVELGDNLSIKKRSSFYVILAKKDQIIYVFNENMNDFLEYLLTMPHSIVILSVDKIRIVLQIKLLF